MPSPISNTPLGGILYTLGIGADAREARTARMVDEELKNYLTAPDETIKAVQNIDPRTGMALADKQRAQREAETKSAREAQDRSLGLMRNYLRGLPEGADIGAAMDQMTPFMQSLGVPEQMLGGFRQAVTANPNALLDDEAYKKMIEDRFSGTVVTPGSIYVRGGKEVLRAPYAMRAETTPAGSSTNVFDPNRGEFVTGGGGGSAPAVPGAGVSGPAPGGGSVALTVEALRPHFSAQESSDDYTAVNAETGALGRYQVMPKTGRALAKRLGLAWRPDMMKKDDPASRRYQDAIGGAAMQESIDFGKGDPSRIFAHYYGGPDERQWGPKTRKYVEEMNARIGGGGAGLAPGSGGPQVTATSVVVPPKPEKPGKSYRAATADELKAAGYPEGTAGQVDNEGKFVNLKTPTAAIQKASKFEYDRAGQALTSTRSMLAQVDRVSRLPGLATATGSFQGRMPGWMLGQDAQDARNELQALRSNVGLNQLMQFKAGSSQGASGFGNLSNAEGDKLERIFGSLDDTTSDVKIQENLLEAKNILSRAAERIQWQMERSEAGLDWKVPPEGAVRNGFKFLGGSPANPANWQRVKKGK